MLCCMVGRDAGRANWSAVTAMAWKASSFTTLASGITNASAAKTCAGGEVERTQPDPLLPAIKTEFRRVCDSSTPARRSLGLGRARQARQIRHLFHERRADDDAHQGSTRCRLAFRVRPARIIAQRARALRVVCTPPPNRQALKGPLSRYARARTLRSVCVRLGRFSRKRVRESSQRGAPLVHTGVPEFVEKKKDPVVFFKFPSCFNATRALFVWMTRPAP